MAKYSLCFLLQWWIFRSLHRQNKFNCRPLWIYVLNKFQFNVWVCNLMGFWFDDLSLRALNSYSWNNHPSVLSWFRTDDSFCFFNTEKWDHLTGSFGFLHRKYLKCLIYNSNMWVIRTSNWGLLYATLAIGFIGFILIFVLNK